MSRQTIVALGIGAVMGVAVLVTLTLDLSGPEPAPDTASVPPAIDAPAPASAALPAASTAPRPTPRAASAATSETISESAAVAPTTATLHITSDVPDAQVFVDRKFIGTAPVTASDIAPGQRTINVSAPGYEGIAETFEIAPGSRDIVMALKVIRLNESIPVKHKHRVGSCEGRLIATPQGLRYETDNKNDGFSVPLTGLETFTMDFLARNLKVKITKGKTYDFTDPDDKPDPLYFFHQAVEKVRVRISKGSEATLARERR